MILRLEILLMPSVFQKFDKFYLRFLCNSACLMNSICWTCYRLRRFYLILTLSIFLSILTTNSNASLCNAPTVVCEWKKRIVGIRTPTMIASGILLRTGDIVTNRHVAEDHETVIIRDSKGIIKKAISLFLLINFNV